MTKEQNFAAHVHQHDSTPFVGVAEITLLRSRYALASLPGFVICLAFKEVRNVFVDSSFWRIVHGFEGFWRNAVEARCFPLFEFGDGTFDFSEGDRGVDVGKAWLLRNKFKGGVRLLSYTQAHCADSMAEASINMLH